MVSQNDVIEFLVGMFAPFLLGSVQTQQNPECPAEKAYSAIFEISDAKDIQLVF